MGDDYKKWLKENRRALDADLERRMREDHPNADVSDIEADDAHHERHQRWVKRTRQRDGSYRGGYYETPIWGWTAGRWAQVLLFGLAYVVFLSWDYSTAGPREPALKAILALIGVPLCALAAVLTWVAIGRTGRNVARTVVRVAPFVLVALLVGRQQLKKHGFIDDAPAAAAPASSGSTMFGGTATGDDDGARVPAMTGAVAVAELPPRAQTPDARAAAEAALIRTQLASTEAFLRISAMGRALDLLDVEARFVVRGEHAPGIAALERQVAGLRYGEPLVPDVERAVARDLETILACARRDQKACEWALLSMEGAHDQALAFAPADPRVRARLVERVGVPLAQSVDRHAARTLVLYARRLEAERGPILAALDEGNPLQKQAAILVAALTDAPLDARCAALARDIVDERGGLAIAAHALVRAVAPRCHGIAKQVAAAAREGLDGGPRSRGLTSVSRIAHALPSTGMGALPKLRELAARARTKEGAEDLVKRLAALEKATVDLAFELATGVPSDVYAEARARGLAVPEVETGPCPSGAASSSKKKRMRAGDSVRTGGAPDGLTCITAQRGAPLRTEPLL